MKSCNFLWCQDMFRHNSETGFKNTRCHSYEKPDKIFIGESVDIHINAKAFDVV
jgi:hypothetical protein